MFSNKENVNMLTELLTEFGISKAVVCPGSRNAPIVHNFCECEAIECFSVTDERSAGFFALGLCMKINEPVVVCVTSGTALLNVAPAVAEAYYQNRQLIVVSADRPRQWIGQQDGQTLPQMEALSPYVRKRVSLPEPANDEERWYCNRLINEALSANRRGCPVHINVPISEPLFDFTVNTLSPQRKITFHEAVISHERMTNIAVGFANAQKPMIVFGQMNVVKADEAISGIAILDTFSVVLREKTADNAAGSAQHFDEILSVIGDDERYKPDYIVYMGGTIVSKRLKKFLRSCKDVTSVFVDQWGEVCDTFMNLTDVVQGLPEDALKVLSQAVKNQPPKAFGKLWHDVIVKARKIGNAYQPSFSQMQAVKLFHETMRKNDSLAALFYGNSSPLRLGNIYSHEYLFANRGTNGIEGTLSTAVGYATAAREERKVYCIIGDLSFFYDRNALWNRNLTANVNVLLLNNGGGGIFHQLPGLEKSPYRDTMISAAHTTSARGVCRENDIDYLSAHDEKELKKALKAFFRSNEKPLLLEVFTDAETDARVVGEYYELFKRKLSARRFSSGEDK